VIYGGAFADPASAMKTPALAFTNNTLRFEFAAPYYDNPVGNRYQFLLEDFDDHWSSWMGETFVDYRHLPEGRYRFRVRAKNIYQSVGDESVFALEILPPWYRTWWSYALYGVLVLVFFYSIRRYEMGRQQLKHRAELESMTAEKLKELDKLKSDFFANISHEFRTPLTLILGPVEEMLKKMTGANQKNLSLIRRNAQRLLQLIDQLLDLSKLERSKLKLQASADVRAYIRHGH
jgi:signal transduction histidine kinase